MPEQKEGLQLVVSRTTKHKTNTFFVIYKLYMYSYLLLHLQLPLFAGCTHDFRGVVGTKKNGENKEKIRKEDTLPLLNWHHGTQVMVTKTDDGRNDGCQEI